MFTKQNALDDSISVNIREITLSDRFILQLNRKLSVLSQNV